MAITITSFTPTGGPTTGGTKVVITGTGLLSADAVIFGTIAGAIDNTVVNTDTSLQVLSPPIDNGGVLAVKIQLVDNAGTGAFAQSTGNYTYTTVSNPVLASTLARKWGMDVDSSVAKDGSGYIPCRGITSLQPTVDTTTQDDSDYDSNGWGSDAKTMLKWSLAGKLSRKMATGFVEDPGQKVLRLAYDKFGAAGVVRVRWYDRNGTAEAYEGYALVKWSEDGGSPSDLSMVSFTLMGQGARTVITNPTL